MKPKIEKCANSDLYYLPVVAPWYDKGENAVIVSVIFWHWLIDFKLYL